jgi:MFS family permease
MEKMTNTGGKLRIARILVPVSVFFFWYSHYVYMPILPDYVRERTQNLTQVGVVLAMYGLWQVIVRLPIGILTDRLGRRKPFILLGIILSGVGAVTIGFAATYPQLVIGRSLIGLSMWAWVLQVVFFGGLFDKEMLIKAGSVLTLSSSFAKLAGTFSAGLMASRLGSIFVFLTAAAASIVAALLMAPVREPVREAGGTAWSRLKVVLKSSKVWTVSLLGAVNQFLNFGITFGFFPIIAATMGADDSMKGYLLSTNILFLIAGNLFVTYKGRRKNAFLIAAAGYLFFTVSVIGTPLSPGLAPLFLLQALLGLAHGLTYPVLIGLCMEDIPDDARASAMGFHQSVYAIGMFLGPWVVGALSDLAGIRNAFFVIGAGTVVMSIALLTVLGKVSRQSE